MPTSPQTLRAIMKDYRPVDDSGPWELLQSDHQDVAVIVQARAAALERLGPDGWALTRRHARYIGIVHRAAPDLGLYWVWWVARKYVIRAEPDPPSRTDDLDLLLALWPWRSEDAFKQYASAARSLFRWKDSEVPGGILDACLMHGEVYQQHFQGD